MNLYFKLQLLRLICMTGVLPNREENPVLFNLLEENDCGPYLTDEPEELKAHVNNLVAALFDEFSYYTSDDLKVNSWVDLFLVELLKDCREGKCYSPREIGQAISFLSKKSDERGVSKGVQAWIEFANSYLSLVEQRVAVSDDADYGFSDLLKKVQYAETVLAVVDGFVIATTLPAPVVIPVADTPQEIDHDFVMGVECNDNCDDCECEFEHIITTLQGLEDLLNGEQTPAASYFEGVALANDVRLVEGTEGAVFDKIKETGTKAYNALLESFNAIRKVITEMFSNENIDQVGETAEANKKSIAAMSDKSANINDSAAKGIIELAEKVDPEGEMKSIVSGLNTPADAVGIIDRLNAYLKAEAGTSGELSKTVKEAETALSDLRKAASDSTKGDEDNADVVNANKQILAEKTNQAKEYLKTLKAQLKAQTTKVSGIRKAISGITPKIFVKGEQ